MGGAINLVSLKPVKPFESEIRAGTMFDNRGAFQGWNSYARIGSRQENFYVQGSVNQLDQNFWSLSRGYSPYSARSLCRLTGGRRTAQRIGHPGLASQPQSWLHAQRHRRIQ